MKCKKCGSDKLSLSCSRIFSQDDGQLENWILRCSECDYAAYRIRWGYRVSSDIIDKVFNKEEDL